MEQNQDNASPLPGPSQPARVGGWLGALGFVARWTLPLVGAGCALTVAAVLAVNRQPLALSAKRTLLASPLNPHDGEWLAPLAGLAVGCGCLALVVAVGRAFRKRRYGAGAGLLLMAVLALSAGIPILAIPASRNAFDGGGAGPAIVRLVPRDEYDWSSWLPAPGWGIGSAVVVAVLPVWGCRLVGRLRPKSGRRALAPPAKHGAAGRSAPAAPNYCPQCGERWTPGGQYCTACCCNIQTYRR